MQRDDIVVDRLRNAARRSAGEEVCEFAAERPVFLWLYGSTMIEASAETDGSVVLRAYLVLGPRQSQALEEQVRLASSTLPLGQLELDEDGDIALVCRVPAGTSPERLEEIIGRVSRQADQLDDVLCARLGGIRSVDRFHEDVLFALGQESAQLRA